MSSDKMKILSVHTSDPDEKGADWWRISNIIQILRANAHEVDVVRYIGKSSYEKLNNRGQDSFVIASTLTVHLKHLKVLRNGDFDLVYGNQSAATFCSVLGRLKGVPLVFDMHGGKVEEFLLNNQSNPKWKYSLKLFGFLMDSIIYFMVLHFSSKIICVSKKMIEYLHNKKGVPLEKMAYVTNGVDLEFFKPVNTEKVKNMKNKLGIEDKLVFGYIGGFHKWQGAENFIEAARKTDDKDLAFLIVGGERGSRGNGIIFIPKIPRAQVPDYYSICDVLVLPRPSNPATEIAAPTKFAEYAAMGKPILTTDVGDAAEFVREYKCGIVVENNKVENLIKGINEFRAKSSEELKMMGKNSRVLSENEFDWGKVRINLLKAVESLK